MLEGLYGETQPHDRARAVPTATSTASPASERRGPWRARTSITLRRRRCARPRSTRCCPFLATHVRRSRAGCTPRDARRASRWKTRANRSRRSSAPGRARSCSRRRAPRRSTRPCGVRCAVRAGAHRTSSRPRSSTRACAMRWPRSRAEVTTVGVDRAGRFDADEVLDAVRDDTALVIGAAREPRGRHACSRPPRSRAARARARRARARRRVRGRRARAGRLPRARRRPLLGHRPQVRRTEGRGRAARPARAADRRRCSSAARRNGRGEAGSRTCPRGSGSAPRAPRATSRPKRREQRALVDVAATVAEQVPGVVRFGAADADASLPNLLCLGVEGVEAEPILLALDQHGVAVHSGSSCSSETLEPSPVLAAMGVDADHSLRVSVGWSTTRADVGAIRGSLPGNRRTTEGVALAMTASVRRLNHAVLYVRDARTSAAFYEEAFGFAVGRDGRRRRRGVHACGRDREPPRPRAVLDRRAARPVPSAAAPACTTSRWEVDTIQDLVDRCATGS